MKPILLDLPMPIITPKLILKPPKIGDGSIVNEAVLESFEGLHRLMPWAKERPTIHDSEEFVRQAAANWILKTNDEPNTIIKINSHSIVNKYEQLIKSESKYTEIINNKVIKQEKEQMIVARYYRYEMELIWEKYGFKNIHYEDRFLNKEHHMTFIAEVN